LGAAPFVEDRLGDAELGVRDDGVDRLVRAPRSSHLAAGEVQRLRARLRRVVRVAAMDDARAALDVARVVAPQLRDVVHGSEALDDRGVDLDGGVLRGRLYLGLRLL